MIGMLEAGDYEDVDPVSTFIGALSDMFCLLKDKAPITGTSK